MDEHHIRTWREWAKYRLPVYSDRDGKQIADLIDTMADLIADADRQFAASWEQGKRKAEVDKQCARDVAAALRRRDYDGIPAIERAAEKDKAAIDSTIREMDKQWHRTKDMQDKARQVFERLTGERFYR